MAIAYNLTRLVVLSVEHGIEINFVGGAQTLADAEWVPLPMLYETMTKPGYRTRDLREATDAAA